MKIAHLSDIHFFKFDYSPRSIFSKNILASLNYLFNRGRHKLHFDIFSIPQVLSEYGVEQVWITGDFTTTSNHQEYSLAQRFINELHALDMDVMVIPGNHDTYNRKAQAEKRFYQYLYAPKALKQSSIALQKINDDIHCITLDTTLATPLWSSQGLFTEELEEKLKNMLDSIDEHQKVIVMNHFPTLTRKKTTQRHRMIGYERLDQLLRQYPNVLAYVCGHTHLSEVIEDQYLVLNSGSLTLTGQGSFHLMDWKEKSVDIQRMQFLNGCWQESKHQRILF